MCWGCHYVIQYFKNEINHEMLAPTSEAALTGPALVSMGTPSNWATPSWSVFRHGCSSSQIFFFWIWTTNGWHITQWHSQIVIDSYQVECEPNFNHEILEDYSRREFEEAKSWFRHINHYKLHFPRQQELAVRHNGSQHSHQDIFHFVTVQKAANCNIPAFQCLNP